MTLTQAKEEYFRTAKDFMGTCVTMQTEMRRLARQLARPMRQADPVASKRKLADAFAAIAVECYATAQAEGWANASQLDISLWIREAVMALK